jgi:hypothetical protein
MSNLPLMDNRGQEIGRVKAIQSENKSVQEATEGMEVAISIPGTNYERELKTVETLYFVLGTFGYGNASLLGKLVSYMIEKNRKHMLTVRFLKKALQIFFQNLPGNFLAVDGLKILIKGRFNKRRRTKTIVLQQGQISLQTLKTPIDYHQTQAITLYGAFGI